MLIKYKQFAGASSFQYPDSVRSANERATGCFQTLHEQTLFSGSVESRANCRRFILKNRFVIDTAPLQIYVSALAFSPEKSLIKSSFRDQLLQWIIRSPAVENEWSPLIITLEGHTSWIETVAFSPDGATVASGSRDHTVRLWDTTTAAERVVDKDSTTSPFFPISESLFTVDRGDINLQSKVS